MHPGICAFKHLCLPGEPPNNPHTEKAQLAVSHSLANTTFQTVAVTDPCFLDIVGKVSSPLKLQWSPLTCGRQNKDLWRTKVMMDSQLHFLLLILLSAVTYTDCRQMCLSCQYVDNPKKDGIECATAPRNWTFGDTRTRCNFRCVIEGHFDKESGMPVYFYRGCSNSNDITPEKCYEDEARVYCSFSCVDDDYCNSRALMPSSKKSSGLRVTAGVVEMLAGTALGLYIAARF